MQLIYVGQQNIQIIFGGKIYDDLFDEKLAHLGFFKILYNAPNFFRNNQLLMNQQLSRSIPGDTPRRTPLNSRTYLSMHHAGMGQSPRMSDSNSNVIQETNSNFSDENGVIYGTNVSVSKVKMLLENFIVNFEVTKIVSGDTQVEKVYFEQLKDYDLDISENSIFNVQGSHIKEYDRMLYYQFVYFPAEMISCFDSVLKELYENYFIKGVQDPAILKEKNQKRQKLMVGITHLDEITMLKNLSHKEINRLICFRGIVIRCSDIYPEMKVAFFRCTNCKAEVDIELDNAKVQEPSICTRCKQKNTMQLIHNLCKFTDKQFIKIQQLPEYIPEGQTPNSLTIISYDNNVDKIRPGDRVQFIGIYRAQPVKVVRGKNQSKSVFNTYIDLISYRVIEENRFRACLGVEKTVFNDDEINQFFTMAQDENIIHNLVQSFAPSIYGHEDIKTGILTQLFGGTKKDLKDAGRGRFRSDINICLVGDPSTAKSQLLQQVYKIAPRGIYTSGRGSSAVGLTANVKKDPETKEFVLESGALVLSDMGICCIDQFDKMDQNSKTILLEAMQQQTISVAKAGIVCQLNTRTAVLSAANPINSKYNQNKSIVQNINLPPALLTRFDLIYIMIDKANEQADKKLVNHMLNLYLDDKTEQMKNPAPFSKEKLAKYITYAREYVNPKLSEAAGQKLVEAYTAMRSVGHSKKIVSATPRQLESLIRISEAFAKMKLCKQITVQDVQKASDLVEDALKKTATDPVTGKINMQIFSGNSAGHKRKISEIIDKIKTILENNATDFTKTTKMSKLKAQVDRQWQKRDDKVTDTEMVEALRKFEKDTGMIAIFGEERSKLVLFRYVKDTTA